jgi:hypothetical protein
MNQRTGSLASPGARLLSSFALAAYLVGCTGGGSANLNPGNPVPVVSSATPSSAFAAGAAFPITVMGTNFVSTSVVQWNGGARATTVVSGVQLQAQITASDIATAGSANVTVFTPAPGGGTSNATPFTISNPTPMINLLNPSFAMAGGAAFPLTVMGTNFVSTSLVEWNGSPRTTAFVSSTQLQAQITASDIAAPTNASVTVNTPSPGGGPSNALTFTINPSTAGTTTVVSQLANDLVWDPLNQVIYLSVPSVAGAATGNTISVLAPLTGAVTKSQFAGSEPDVLAISGDSQFLYAGIDGSASIQRFTLPGPTPDINYSLGSSATSGPFFALDLQVAPGFPRTAAVSLAVFNSIPAALGGITIFDDAAARPTIAKGFGPGGGGAVLYDSLQWGSDATELFAANNESTGFDLYSLKVNASGVTLAQDFANSFDLFFNRIHFDPGTKLVYSDDGHIINPGTGLPVGVFLASGLMIPDSGLNTAFFLGQTQAQAGTKNFTIESFDLTQFTPITSVAFFNVAGNPIRLIRWGANGLAFNTDGGQLILFSGNFVSAAAASIPRQALKDHVQRTWKASKRFAPPGLSRATGN